MGHLGSSDGRCTPLHAQLGLSSLHPQYCTACYIVTGAPNRARYAARVAPTAVCHFSAYLFSGLTSSGSMCVRCANCSSARACAAGPLRSASICQPKFLHVDPPLEECLSPTRNPSSCWASLVHASAHRWNGQQLRYADRLRQPAQQRGRTHQQVHCHNAPLEHLRMPRGFWFDLRFPSRSCAPTRASHHTGARP